MDARRTDGTGRTLRRLRAPIGIVVLLGALIGALLVPMETASADPTVIMTLNSTLSVRSGDLCKLKPAPPTSGRTALRNFVCLAKTPGPAPVLPWAPKIQTMYGGGTLTIVSGDGCAIKAGVSTGPLKWVRNYVCVARASTPPPPPPPQNPPGGTSASAGTTVGAAQYPVPSGAIIVSPSGNDGAAGTAAAPLKTMNGAVARATSGKTIVLRAGTYHESVVIPADKRLTVQAWPGEAVWMDGSVPVTGWVASGSVWRKDSWTTKFDHSPTYTRGAPDNTGANWGFVDPNYPMAAHPDQIWIDGAPQRQVASLAQVVPGTFFHDEAGSKLYLGTDPTGKGVRASNLVQALMVRSGSSVVRGFGVRRYAPSVPDMGAVTIEEPGILVENLAVTDNSTTGLFVGGGTVGNVVLRHLYVARNGMLGIGATYADNLTIDKVVSESNNTERFNQAPVSGGVKIARTRRVGVWDSVFRGNYGPGVWMDESTYDMTLEGNEMRNNAGHGTSLEISAKAVFANNYVTNNGGFGIKINNTSGVSVWNNTFVGNDRSINLVEDDRRPTTANTTGRDKRQKFPDPTMTWLIGPAGIANNIIASQKSGNCMLCVEDYSGQRTAAQIGIVSISNIYNRPNANLPSNLVVWANGAANPFTYSTLNAFRSATGQEAGGQLVTNAGLLDANGYVVGGLSNTATPLAISIAALTGYSVGMQYLGAFPR